MATATSTQDFEQSYHLRTSRYDQVSSLLISLLILIGTLVFILLVAWLTSQLFFTQTAVPVELADFAGDDGPVGGGQTPEPPNPEEIRELEEEPVITETLTAISSVVKTTIPQLDDPMIAHKKTSGMGFGHGEGRGRGDGKGDGSGGRSRRWEVRFDRTNLDNYARQLDFFRIEVAVLFPDGRVAYVKNFTKPRPDVRYVNNPSESEKRYYLTWRKGELQQADYDLLARGGIDAKQCIIVKFLPSDLEQKLVAMEQARAGGRDTKSIRRTRFGIQTSGDGYEFFVLEQTYK